MRTNGHWLGWALAAVLLGCGQEAAETTAPERPGAEARTGEAPPVAGEAEPEAATEAAAPAGPRAEEESYLLEARPEEAGYSAGNLGQFAIHLSGRGEWHLNQDFPFSVELEGPAAVAFPKATLEKGDAAEFGEVSARVDVPFTPASPGEHEVRARVLFAVCNPTSCVPKTATLALNLRVD